jgi:hypothetical protein
LHSRGASILKNKKLNSLTRKPTKYHRGGDTDNIKKLEAIVGRKLGRKKPGPRKRKN